MCKSKSKIAILYGSETGNGKEIAEVLYRKIRSIEVPVFLCELNNYDFLTNEKYVKILLVICSTIGQGEIPQNGKKFMNFLLKKRHTSQMFLGVSLSTFGLGNSLYIHFNYAIKKIQTRLKQLGCVDFCEGCEADESVVGGYYRFYIEWEKIVLKNIREHFVIDEKIEKNNLSFENIITINEEEIKCVDCYSRKGKYSGKVILNERISSKEHFREIRRILIKTEGLTFEPGDSVSFFPSNNDVDVQKIFEIYPEWKTIADKKINFEKKICDYFFGSELTLRILFKYYFDITLIPRKCFFMNLVYCIDESTPNGKRDKDKIKELSTLDDSISFYNYVVKSRRLILEVLCDFHEHLKIPLNCIFDLFPVIYPRSFLISFMVSSSIIEITFGVIDYEVPKNRKKKGLCSNWLKNTTKNSNLSFNMTPNSFFPKKLPDSTPYIFVSPGLGISPIRFFIQSLTSSEKTLDLYLYHGCRNKLKDFLYTSFWSSLVINKKLNLYLCFSQDHSYPHKHVQDYLMNQSKLIYNLIVNQNAYIFVCGSTGLMPSDVRQTFKKIILENSKMLIEESDLYFKKLYSNKRYREETW